MPTIEENIRMWSQQHDWSHNGDEWSRGWGNTQNLWNLVIYPRIKNFISEDATIVEIAPGYGRCTQYLRILAKKLQLVDMNQNCIEACKQRFSKDHHIEYYVNDGRSLNMIPSRSADFIFSWDSLVHAELDVLSDYIHEIADKLTDNGFAFIHHSNMNAYWDKHFKMLKIQNIGWRAVTVSAEHVRQIADKAGLHCMIQEIVNFDQDELTDCFTVFVKKTSKYRVKSDIQTNNGFRNEAFYIRRMASQYSLDLPVIRLEELAMKRTLIYLWGTGSLAERGLTFLSNFGLNLVGAIDNNSKKHGGTFGQLRIYSPTKLEEGDSKAFIFVCSMYYDEISEQLKSIGYLENQDFISIQKFMAN